MPVRVVAVADPVQVHRQDVLLAVGVLDLDREDDVLDLQRRRAVIPVLELELGQLLRDRRCTLRRRVGLEVGEPGAHDAGRVEAGLRVEARVLDGDRGLRHVGAHLAQRLLVVRRVVGGPDVGHQPPGCIVDLGVGGQRLLGQHVGVGQVGGVGHVALGAAQERRHRDDGDQRDLGQLRRPSARAGGAQVPAFSSGAAANALVGARPEAAAPGVAQDVSARPGGPRRAHLVLDARSRPPEYLRGVSGARPPRGGARGGAGAAALVDPIPDLAEPSAQRLERGDHGDQRTVRPGKRRLRRKPLSKPLDQCCVHKSAHDGARAFVPPGKTTGTA